MAALKKKAAPAPATENFPFKKDGARLKATREALGICTQEAFAKEIGIKKNTWNEIESGRKELSKNQAKAIFHRWRISLDWLFCADGTKLPNELYAKLRAFAE